MIVWSAAARKTPIEVEGRMYFSWGVIAGLPWYCASRVVGMEGDESLLLWSLVGGVSWIWDGRRGDLSVGDGAGVMEAIFWFKGKF
jgi:hypothetical protein